MREVGCDYFFDTVTLSNFALAGCLELLINRYGSHAIVTPEVMDEITAGVAVGIRGLREIEDAVFAGRIGSLGGLTFPEREIFRELLRVLRRGRLPASPAHRRAGELLLRTTRRHGTAVRTAPFDSPAPSAS